MSSSKWFGKAGTLRRNIWASTIYVVLVSVFAYLRHWTLEDFLVSLAAYGLSIMFIPAGPEDKKNLDRDEAQSLRVK